MWAAAHSLLFRCPQNLPAQPAQPSLSFRKSHFSTWALQLAAAQDAYTALPTPEGLLCYQPPGSRPSHPFGSHSQSLLLVPTFPAIWKGSACGLAWEAQAAPLPPRRVQYRDWGQIPGLRGWRTYRIYCSFVTCVMMMMMMMMVERTPTRPREKETPASLGTPAPRYTHTCHSSNQSDRQSVRHLPIAEPA